MVHILALSALWATAKYHTQMPAPAFCRLAGFEHPTFLGMPRTVDGAEGKPAPSAAPSHRSRLVSPISRCIHATMHPKLGFNQRFNCV
jgi:hypothetical protein